MGNKSLWVHSIIPINVEHRDRRIADSDNPGDEDGTNVIKRIGGRRVENDRYGNRIDRNKAAIDRGGDRRMHRGVNIGNEMDMILVFLFNR